jgi:hypothetical protein
VAGKIPLPAFMVAQAFALVFIHLSLMTSPSYHQRAPRKCQAILIERVAADNTKVNSNPVHSNGGVI